MLSLRSICVQRIHNLGPRAVSYAQHPFDFAQGMLFGTKVPQDEAKKRVDVDEMM